VLRFDDLDVCLAICRDSSRTFEHTSKMEEVHVELEGDRDLLITGYTWTYFGEFCYFLCCLVSLHWIALYVLILVDTYNKCEVGGIDNLCFFGNNVIFGTYELNGKVRSSILFHLRFWFMV
jgi:hypothetical protein